VGYQGLPQQYVGVPVGGQQRGGPKVPRNPNNKGGAPRAGGAPACPGGVPAGAGYPNIKYNTNVRNQQGAPVAQVLEIPATATTPEERKQFLGENLYPLIGSSLRNLGQETLAGKITGMILDSLAEQELLNLIANGDSLNAKIAEALDVLEAAQAEQNQTQKQTPETGVNA